MISGRLNGHNDVDQRRSLVCNLKITTSTFRQLYRKQRYLDKERSEGRLNIDFLVVVSRRLHLSLLR